MKCSNCGYENDSRNKSCRICGMNLHGNNNYGKPKPDISRTPQNNYNYQPTGYHTSYNEPEPKKDNGNDDWVWLICGCCCIAIIFVFAIGGMSPDNSGTAAAAYASSDCIGSYENAYPSQSDINCSNSSNKSNGNYYYNSDNGPPGVPSTA